MDTFPNLQQVRLPRWAAVLWILALCWCASVASATTVAQLSDDSQTRWIEFETSEGTWMSLDVAPTGDLLVFELLGDIYSLPPEGGRAVPILTGRAFQSQPRFSPDGSTLVYISDASGADNVWLANADGTNARQLSNRPRDLMWSPEWSPDGRSIFVSVTADDRPKSAEIWRYPVEQEGETEALGELVVANSNGRAAFLISAPPPGAFGPHVAPDGASLLFTSVTPRPYGSRDGAKGSLARRWLDAGDDAVEPLPVDGDPAMKPALTPDGKTLVYATLFEGKTGLKARQLDTGKERWLAHPIQRHQLEGRATRDVLPNYAITSDGGFVYAAFGGKIHRLALVDTSAEARVEIPFIAQVRLAATPSLDFPRRIDTGPVRARQLRQPSVAVDGRLAFSSLGRIFIASSDGANIERLTNTDSPREFMPAFSPDGRWVAFVTWGEEGGHLWVAQTDATGAPQRLSDSAAFWADPAWSPDGGSVLVVKAPLGGVRGARGLPPHSQVVEVAVDPSGSNAGPERVLRGTVGLRRPHFGREDGKVYLSDARGGLVSVAYPESANTRQVEAKLTASRDVVMLSPDGRRLAGVVGGKLMVFDRPQNAAQDADRTLNPEEGLLVSEAVRGGFGWSPAAAGVDGANQLVFAQATQIGVWDPVSQSTTSVGAKIEVSRPRPSGEVVLRGATVLTMNRVPAQGSGALVGEAIPAADVVVRNNRIAAVGPSGTVGHTADARVIDVTGTTIVPGFIDLHAHFAQNPDFLEPESTTTFANLALGITSVRNPQSPPDVFGLADTVEANGGPSPRIFSTGPGVQLGFGGGGNYLAPSVDSLDAVRAALSVYRDEYETHAVKSYIFGNREQRQWMVQASREAGLMPTTEGGADTKANLTHAIDGFSGLEHAFPVAPIYDDIVQLVAQTEMTYTPTLVVAFGGALPVYRLLAERRPHEKEQVSRWFAPGELYANSSRRVLWFPPEAYNDRDAATGAKKILEAGGRVGLGGHGEVQGLSNHWEMELLAEGGMAPYDVLRVATVFGAEALGLEQDLGTIEPGKLADLVVLERDPRSDIRATTALRFVMRDGVLYSAHDLSQVWPSSEPGPRPWWNLDTEDSGDGTRVPMSRRIDQRVRETMTAGRLPGAAVAVIREGKVVHASGYGIANLELHVPVTKRTLFQSGSVGKQFTAAGVMALVEDQRLDLDSSIRTVLTETPESWQPITVRHLLTHASGIPDYTAEDFDYTTNYSQEELVSMASELELEFPSGTRWNYSNTGYVMLGIIMERVAGKPYWEFLAERIFQPAGMPTIRVNTEPDVVANRARGYVPVADGWENAGWVAPNLNRTADGSMMLSLEDMIAWDQVVRNRSVLSAASWDAILSPMTLSSGNPYPYGFGWFVQRQGADGETLVHQHGGAWQGFTTQYSHYPDEDLSVIVLGNARSFATTQIAAQLAELLVPALVPTPAPSTVITDPDRASTEYVSAMLTKAANGSLERGDFAFLRQTLFPRIKMGLSRGLEGLGEPSKLELLARTREGDDVVLQYWAWYSDGAGANRRFRVFTSLGPEGGLTSLRVQEER